MHALVWILRWTLAFAFVAWFTHWTWPWGLLAIPLLVAGVYVNRDVVDDAGRGRRARTR